MIRYFIYYMSICSIFGCYNGPKYNISSWCIYHNGVLLNHKNSIQCRFNNKTLARNAANDPLKMCIYDWAICNDDNDCNKGSGHIYCVKNGCCGPGYCMIDNNGVFYIPNYFTNYTINKCLKNGGVWNNTSAECMWYEIQCG